MKIQTPKSLRLQIAVFGRANVGKSSFINAITGQNVSIVSAEAGTTTDAVEKAMEIAPIGPVVFIDTAGVNDTSELAGERIKRTAAVFGRADVFVVVTESGVWGEHEEKLREEARERDVPLVAVVNKTDLGGTTDDFRERLKKITPYTMECSCIDNAGQNAAINAFRDVLVRCLPNKSSPLEHPIAADLIPVGGLAILVTPIDAGAPKGRLILPQVMVIRDILDGHRTAMVVGDDEYLSSLSILNKNPDMVICDSQVVNKIAEQTPPDIPLTTFSILFARLKGDLEILVRGAAAIDTLKKGDRVLIAEACAHHAAADDIGRVKIPNLLRKHTGLGDGDLHIDTYSGRDYPAELERYSLIIHCGACMLTRREMLLRIKDAVNKNVPITNYGVAITYFCGVLDRAVDWRIKCVKD
ncbi:MAG: [FeFe] hydrogenase H-cluster maturation GTPase HydF [Chitinispirillales bacterium]|jgi:[FeFe] hydrogenase H-cluster maturation GTPase HydF|nr:[FeFe] hydrogenase H-cluster maturation GTPase HydF [Chitinispirillales bacterium]